MNVKKLFLMCLAVGAVARADVPTYSNAQEALYDAIKHLDVELVKISIKSLEQADKTVPLIGCLNMLDKALVDHKFYKKWGWRLTATTGLGTVVGGSLTMLLAGLAAEKMFPNEGVAVKPYLSLAGSVSRYVGAGIFGIALLYRAIAYHRLYNRVRRVLNMLKKSPAVTDGGEQALAELVLARVQRKL